MTDFEWDPRKAAANVRKHEVQFADAVSVLEDQRAITLRDTSAEEERWVTIGMDALARVLTVVYTWRGNAVRVISARAATPNESRQYLEDL
ncbi:MAG: BrnT family toxin [Bryobacter sp.]|nr:BrnT family toxin [Bryobacter sp.]